MNTMIHEELKNLKGYEELIFIERNGGYNWKDTEGYFLDLLKSGKSIEYIEKSIEESIIKIIVQTETLDLRQDVFEIYKKLLQGNCEKTIRIIYDTKNKKCCIDERLINQTSMALYKGEHIEIVRVNITKQRMEDMADNYLSEDDMLNFAEENNIEVEENLSFGELKELCQQHKDFKGFDKDMLENYLEWKYDYVADTISEQLEHFLDIF